MLITKTKTKINGSIVTHTPRYVTRTGQNQPTPTNYNKLPVSSATENICKNRPPVEINPLSGSILYPNKKVRRIHPSFFGIPVGLWQKSLDQVRYRRLLILCQAVEESRSKKTVILTTHICSVLKR